MSFGWAFLTSELSGNNGDIIKKTGDFSFSGVSSLNHDAEEGKFTFDPTLEELEIIADKDGYTTATETTGGTIANVGSYLVGGIGLLNGMRRLATTSPSAFRAFARRNPNMSEFGGGVVAGVTTDQWLTNPNNASLTASLVDIPESAVFGMGEYLQAPDEDDSDSE